MLKEAARVVCLGWGCGSPLTWRQPTGMEANRALSWHQLQKLGLVRLFIEIWGCELMDGRTDPAHRHAFLA